MSIKHFHVLFITVAALLMLFFSYWAFTNFQEQSKAGYLLTAVISLLLAVGLGVYEFKFIKKTKSFS